MKTCQHASWVLVQYRSSNTIPLLPTAKNIIINVYPNKNLFCSFKYRFCVPGKHLTTNRLFHISMMCWIFQRRDFCRKRNSSHRSPVCFCHPHDTLSIVIQVTLDVYLLVRVKTNRRKVTGNHTRKTHTQPVSRFQFPWCNGFLFIRCPARGLCRSCMFACEEWASIRCFSWQRNVKKN